VLHPISRGPAGGGGNFAPTPNGFRVTATPREMVLIAYGPPGSQDSLNWNTAQIVNHPGWFGSDRYDIDARVSQADLRAWLSQSAEHELLRLALRAEFKERFGLAIHEQPSRERMYELVVRKDGPRLGAATPGSAPPEGVKLASGGFMTPIGDRANGGLDLPRGEHAGSRPASDHFYTVNACQGSDRLDRTLRLPVAPDSDTCRGGTGVL